MKYKTRRESYDGSFYDQYDSCYLIKSYRYEGEQIYYNN